MTPLHTGMNMGRIRLFTILGVVIAFLFFFGFNEMIPQVKKGNLFYSIQNRWDLPAELREVSGIAWLENEKIAAVQDEDGTIFIYDLNKEAVEKEIGFGEPGDYEGIAVKDADAYVLRSDGTIIEILNFENSGRTINYHKTPFTNGNNMETLEFDQDGNRLLISPKDDDPNSDRFKGIYAFSLDTKKLSGQAVFKIDMADIALKRFRDNDLYKTFRPSDMAIHPKTREIYLIEGSQPKLMILDPSGSPRNVYSFDKKVFPQPEGITFGRDGTLFISCEGSGDDNATITELNLKS